MNSSTTNALFRIVSLGLVWGLSVPRWVEAGCNGNGIDDAEEIAAGTAADCNANQIPDACELAPLDLALFGVEIHPDGIPGRPVAADLNGDGFEDLAIGASEFLEPDFNEPGFIEPIETGFTLWVSLGSGEGTFEHTKTFYDGNLTALLIGHFNHDDAPDLVLVTEGVVAVLWNNGAGTFIEKTNVDLPPDSGTVAVVPLGVAGLDGLVALNTVAPRLDLFTTSGERTFAMGISIMLPEIARGLAPADYNRDGIVDLAVTYGSRPTLSLLPGTGTGTFVESDPAQDFDVLLQAASEVLAADFDADGDVDLALANGAAVAVTRNESGSFPVATVYDEGRPNSLAVADVDADADLDLIVGRRLSTALLVRRNIAFDFSLTSSLPTGLNPRGVTTLDIDSDGDEDFAAVVGESSNSHVLLVANGNRLQSDTLRFATSTKSTQGPPHSIALADFDRDGLLDVCTPNGDRKTVSVLLGGSDGMFQSARTYRFLNSAESHLFFVAAGDLDGDGFSDIVVADRGRHLLRIRFNAGGATFLEGGAYPSGNEPRMVVTADMTGDGLVDLVSANGGNDSVSIIAGLGERLFAEKQDVVVKSFPRCVAAVDFDGDGPLDLAVATRNASAFSVHRNMGGGTFAEPTEYPLIGRPNFLQAADFDVDGEFDLAIVHSGFVTIFAGDGNGAFLERGTVDTLQEPRSLATGDVDGDSWLDVVTANPNGDAFGSVSLVRGTGDGNLHEPVRYAVGRRCRSVAAGDIEGDGDVDLISANRSSENITILRNDMPRVATYVTGICTELEYFDLSVALEPPAEAARSLRYFAPVVEIPGVPIVVFERTDGVTSAAAFLAHEFPQAFPDLSDEDFAAVALARPTRQLYTGELFELRSPAGRAYGFSLHSDSGELPLVGEVRAVFEALRPALALDVLGYFPTDDAARASAALWVEPSFPILTATSDAAAPFRRGDVDASGDLNITDGSRLLNHLFIGSSPIPCAKAADADDSGELDVSDALYLLNFLFLGGPEPAEPFQECGADPTDDALSCDGFAACP